MDNQTPENKARDVIDEMLKASGWLIQDVKSINLSAGVGVAVREYPTDSGAADYILFTDRIPVGVIEAKKDTEGERLMMHESQADRYATDKLKWTVQNKELPFRYVSTGTITQFWNSNDPKPRSREIFSFHKPQTLLERYNRPETLRTRLQHFPELVTDGLRECQIIAITEIEKSFAEARPRALIQMATGSGKTFTSINMVYRLLKYAKAKRILFLVDTKNLGEQTEQEYQAFTPNDDTRKFTELYTVQRLSSSFIDPSSQVCISTIQRMYSILRGEEMDESAEETSLNEIQQPQRQKEVAYNPQVPLEMFDVIIVDEAHRSIYNLWRQVLEYFDAFIIGLTATPDNRTYGFFQQNVVSEYTHEEAVADGVNVGYDEYIIETKIGKEGAKIEAKEYVDKRNRLTREKRWEQLDEDEDYSAKQLDRNVVNPSQIRTIVKTFKSAMQNEIFPNRNEIPKTLIFAKTDSHANDIIKIVREEFAEGNDFCKKVTYGNDEEKPSEVLQQFRNSYNPRIAVTVDMIATGTDVKAIECLLFMRDVKSRNYFEQMKGRGTRTLKGDDLRKVTPSATSNKTHFVIVDAVGVTKSLKTDSRPLERKKSVSLKDLMMQVVMGEKDEDTLTSLANRLTRLEKQISPKERENFEHLAGGKSINKVVHELLEAFDGDKIEERAKHLLPAYDSPDTTPKLQEDAQEQAKSELINEAALVFDEAKLREYIENVRKQYDQIIDITNIDEVVFKGFDKQAKEKADEVLTTFRSFLKEQRDEITALSIFFNTPHRRKDITFKMIQELNEALSVPPYNLTTERVWSAYEQVDKDRVKQSNAQKMLTDIVSLIRFETGADKDLRPFSEGVNKRFQDWVFAKNAGHKQFTEEQMNWLRLIKDHIISSVHIEKDDLDLGKMAAKGGLGKFYQVFGDDMEKMIDELNELAA